MAYFARKFEALVDVATLARAEAQALRFEPARVQAASPVFNATWINHWDARFDHGEYVCTELSIAIHQCLNRNEKIFEKSHTCSDCNQSCGNVCARHVAGTFTATMYDNLARALYESSAGDGGMHCAFKRLLTASAYEPSNVADVQLLLSVESECEGARVELLVARRRFGKAVADRTAGGYALRSIEFGRKLDLKEELFRDFVSLPLAVGHRSARRRAATRRCRIAERNAHVPVPVGARARGRAAARQ